jgi:hypothetical protein
MTIRKRNPNSEFWKAAEAASRRVDKFPPWKLGVICKHERQEVYQAVDGYRSLMVCRDCGQKWTRDT